LLKVQIGLASRTAEEQDVAVRVLELETTQAVMGVLQWLGKLDIARRKFGRQRIRIRNVKVSVPTCRGLSLVVSVRRKNTFFEIATTLVAGDMPSTVEFLGHFVASASRRGVSGDTVSAGLLVCACHVGIAH